MYSTLHEFQFLEAAKYRLDLPRWHINTFPPLNIFLSVLQAPFSALLLPPPRSVSLLPLPPAPLLSSTQCSLTHILSVCLFSDSLSDLYPPAPDLEADWLQPGPGSCVLLVLCHDRGTLAGAPSICLEELKDALSLQGPLGQGVHIRNYTQQTFIWRGKGEKLKKSIPDLWKDHRTTPSNRMHRPARGGVGDARGGLRSKFSRVSLYLLLDCSPPPPNMSSWQAAGTIQYPSRHTVCPAH